MQHNVTGNTMVFWSNTHELPFSLLRVSKCTLEVLALRATVLTWLGLYCALLRGILWLGFKVSVVSRGPKSWLEDWSA